MTLTDSLTPKNTEEIKPGLFIQKKGNGYRMIDPVAWNGKILWKKQIRSVISLRFVITITIVLFLVWAYNQDIGASLDFYNLVHEDPLAFCLQVEEDLRAPDCTAWLEQQNLCTNFSKIEVKDWDINLYP